MSESSQRKALEAQIQSGNYTPIKRAPIPLSPLSSPSVSSPSKLIRRKGTPPTTPTKTTITSPIKITPTKIKQCTPQSQRIQMSQKLADKRNSPKAFRIPHSPPKDMILWGESPNELSVEEEDPDDEPKEIKSSKIAKVAKTPSGSIDTTIQKHYTSALMAAKRTKRTPNAVWRYFTKNGILATCNSCSHSYNIAGSNNSSGNGRKHLEKCKCSGGLQYCKDLGIPIPSNNSIQLFFKKDNKFSVYYVQYLINMLIVTSNSPFSLVENKYMQQILSLIKLDEKFVTNRNITTESITSLFKKKKENIKQFIRDNTNSTTSFNFIIDVWSQKKTYYLGVAVSFGTIQFSQTNIHLALKEIINSTAVSQVAAFEAICIDFNIPITNILTIVSDNANTNDKIVSILNSKYKLSIQRGRCFTHIVNLMVQTFLDHLNCAPSEKFNTLTTDEEEEINTEKLLKYVEPIEGVPMNIVQKIRFLSLLLKRPKMFGCFKSLLFNGHESEATDLPIDMKVRWSSTYTMLISAEKLWTYLIIMPNHPVFGIPFTLNDQDYDELCLLIKILKKFYDVTMLCESHSFSLMGNIFPYYNSLFDFIQECFSDLNLKLYHPALLVTKKKLELYYSETELNIHYISNYLNPHLGDEYFKSKDWIDHAPKAQLFLEEQFKLFTRNLFDNVSRGLTISNSTVHLSTELSSLAAIRLDYLKNKKPFYVNHPLEFYKKHRLTIPILAKLSLSYLTIPIGSVDVERLFSKAGLVKTKLRSSMLPKNLEILVSLKCWEDDHTN